nr:MAG TPA: hypothetical protein [Caudoviricetes sp.]
MKGYIVNMAKTSNNAKTVENTIPDEITSEFAETKPLNMEEKIMLKNLANWMVGFNKIESNGEVNINAGGSVRVSRAEVISQYENGNKLLRGDGDGTHATIYIDDKATRDYLDITSELIDKNKVKKIFAINGLDDFRNEIYKTFTTQAEKVLLIKIIRECGFNDFNKIRECEALCGMTV